MGTLTFLFYLTSAVVFWSGLFTLVYYPLALTFELRRAAALRRSATLPLAVPAVSISAVSVPTVSVIVPAYNEARVIGACVASIIACPYPDKEIILVDDGSCDATLELMQRFAAYPEVTVLSKANGGKASALNLGLARASGEIIFCVDADGIFAADTITQMLTTFEDPRVGAVCGNDTPSNLQFAQTRLLNLLSHIGTGFVRRALALIDCLPIVAGNLGAFRREALEKTGPFLEGFIGEDLELTWRIHKAGYRVKFQPRSLVYAEVPSTVVGLWKQRVRWARGLLQTARLHWTMLCRPKYGLFAFFLPLNLVRAVVVPAFQLFAAVLLLLLLLLGQSPVAPSVLGTVSWLGLGAALVTAVYAVALDRAWKDLKYLYVLPLWLPYSLFLSAVMIWATVLELRGKEAKWHKLERTGVVGP